MSIAHMARQPGLLFVFALSISIVSISAVRAEEPEREFLSGYAGSLPSEKGLLARTYFDDPAVRALLYGIEDGPATREEVTAALAPTPYTVEDLLRVKILREMEGRYYIGFNYFTAQDMQAIEAAAEKYVPDLVTAFRARQDEFEVLFAAYPQKSVSSDRLGFVLIAGLSLNWDALTLTEERGWRVPETVTEDGTGAAGWEYSFWASEVTEDGPSRKGYYWGSSTFPGGGYNFTQNPVDYSFSSFGDPYSDPRMNFPDLLYLPGAAMTDDVHARAEAVGLADRAELDGTIELQDALGLEIARPVSRILFALREAPRQRSTLIGLSGMEDAARAGALIDLLAQTGYLEAEGEQYHLLTPVLDETDRALVDGTLALSREITAAWLEENYPLIREDLSGLTALRHGAAYEALFTQIWHELFGKATHDLVAAGVIADPYAEEMASKGSLPLLWRMSLYDFQPG